jgi:hypothetical protein
VRHLADAPDVDVPFSSGGQQVAEIGDLGFGQQGKLDVDATDYLVSVKVAGTDITALGPYQVSSASGVAYFAYVVGSVSGGTLTPLLHTIDL